MMQRNGLYIYFVYEKQQKCVFLTLPDGDNNSRVDKKVLALFDDCYFLRIQNLIIIVVKRYTNVIKCSLVI